MGIFLKLALKVLLKVDFEKLSGSGWKARLVSTCLVSDVRKAMCAHHCE